MKTDSTRVVALDWMRGLVMVLMTVDHASVFYNAGRLSDDSAAAYVAGSPLPLGQFLLRWVTHLCAPTFLFLAGAALSHSVLRRQAAGMPERHIDRDLLIRGALLVALDLTYMSALAGNLLLQVLYAIGVAMMGMAALRRLPDLSLLALSGAWWVLGEALTGLVWDPPDNSSVPWALLVARSVDADGLIFYPALPWLAMMMLGWVFGRHLARAGTRVARRTLLVGGVLVLAVFATVRGLRGYGNMWLQAGDDSLQQWLHVSKYPPSLAYAALELGLMACILAGLMWLAERVRASRDNPIYVLGQTALFYYLAHFLLLGGSKRLLQLDEGGPTEALLAAALALGVLYPCCLWYRRYKAAHPSGFVRFI